MKRMLRFKARIKDGALVGQDFSACRWRDDGTVFDIHMINEERARCVAYGYGVIGSNDGKSYGNGALFANKNDLTLVED